LAQKKIRVHELSKELGLTSKELLTLAQKLGIGASSPSASIEDAQADRIREGNQGAERDEDRARE
jgi:translation initiation factor IF-2